MKDKLIPVVSIVVGFLAFVLTLQYWKSEHEKLAAAREKLRRETEEISVVVAAREIPQGVKISMNDLGKAALPRPAIPPDAVQIPDATKIVGRKTLFQISKRQPFTWSNIEGGNPAAQSLASIITHQMRAISISVGGANAVSGMVQPNDRVDVLGTYTFPSKKTPGEMETVTQTVLQDVTVLATGQQLANQPLTGQNRLGRSTGYSTITVEVTPQEAELLVFAQQAKGQLSLALRNPTDASYETSLPSVNFEHIQNKLQEYNSFRQTKIRKKASWNR